MDRSRSVPVILFVLALVLGAGLLVQRERMVDSFSLASDVPFGKLSKAVRGPDGSLAVVFDSNKRIARVSVDGELMYLLTARNEPGKGFFFANEITFGEGGALYVASTFLDTATLTVNREAVVRFTPEGHPDGILYSIDHTPEEYTDNTGWFRALEWTPDGLRLCITREEGIQCLLLDPASGAIRQDVLTPHEGGRASLIYAAVAADGREMAFSTAAAEIYTAVPGEAPVKRYDGRELPDEVFSIPSDLHYLGGVLHFSDLGRDAIMRLTGDNRAQPVFNEALARPLGYEEAFFECKSFQIAPGHLVLPNRDRVVHMETGKPSAIRTLGQARGNAGLWAGRVAIWLQMALLAGIVGVLVSWAVRHSSPEARRMAKQAALVGLMLATAVGITTYMIFSNMSRRLEEEATKNLRGYLEVGRIVLDADAVDRIRHVKDYMNADYQAVLKQLCQTITREGNIDPGTYSGVYKVFGNKLAALAYHDGLRGIFYPYDYQYSESVYAKVAATGEPYVGVMEDIYGVWLNGVIPLKSSAGEMVGFLEVGVDQSAYGEANRALFRKTVIDLAMVLFVLLFIFSEVGFFSSHVLDRSDRMEAAALQRYDEGALRFVSFLAITGVFLSAPFLPLFSKALAVPVGSLPLDIVIGLPMVIETLSGAVIALLYGHIRFRAGIKLDIVAGCLVIAGGMVATALAKTFPMLIGGRVGVGMGMGLLMIAYRTYFLIEKDEGRKESGIIALTAGVVAGINTGSVSGGMLAARVGMAPVFWVQAALLVVSAVAALFLVRNRHRPVLGMTGGGGPSALRFVLDRAVWSFFVFAFLPVTACGLFLGFLFPLFAEGQGCTTNEISLAFMLFGLCSVYLGPSLTRLTTYLFGARRAITAGALVMAGGMLVFAYFQTLVAAYVTIILFGLTESFIFNQGMSYFSSLGGVRRFGEDKAMGVYNVFESGGEALGPMAFGLAMSLSLATGIAAIAAALGVSALAFLGLSRSAGGPRP